MYCCHVVVHHGVNLLMPMHHGPPYRSPPSKADPPEKVQALDRLKLLEGPLDSHLSLLRCVLTMHRHVAVKHISRGTEEGIGTCTCLPSPMGQAHKAPLPPPPPPTTSSTTERTATALSGHASASPSHANVMPWTQAPQEPLAGQDSSTQSHLTAADPVGIMHPPISNKKHVWPGEALEGTHRLLQGLRAAHIPTS